ncbi:MAG: DUF2752 domain-containing protein [Alistipes sp.]|nr:DUF2752 domain-containing protein [Alistipes sp.]MDE6861523.1 DUF2752 domain-containing protein [Alistipes sp.]
MARNKLRPVIIVCGIALIVVYYWLDPCTWWTPKCPFKLWTGYSCPACGAQRALHAALHLDFYAAVRCNLFLIIGLPYLSAAVVSHLSGRRYAVTLRRIVASKPIVWSYLFMFFIWWIVRNILQM